MKVELLDFLTPNLVSAAIVIRKKGNPTAYLQQTLKASTIYYFLLKLF